MGSACISMGYNFPPRRNESSPSANHEVLRAIEQVARVPDCNKPVFRVVWCQDEPHNRRYIAWIKSDPILACPVLGPDGNVLSNLGFWQPGDPAAPAGATTVERREIIGINRWAIEYADSITKDEWEKTRYYQTVESDPSSIIDARGPYPEDGLRYELVCYLMTKEHNRNCPNPLVDSYRCCYGQYRAPRWRDVEFVRAVWQGVAKERSNRFGFREQDNQTQMNWAMEATRKETVAEEMALKEHIAREADQILTPYSDERLRYGLDYIPADAQKYHIGGLPTTVRDNQRPSE